MVGKDDLVKEFLMQNKEILEEKMQDMLPVFKKVLKEDGIQGLMQYANQFIDAIHDKVDMRTKTTCSNGCSFCCYTDINLSSFEASYILGVLDYFKIPINTTRLMKQQAKKWHKLKYNEKRCIMLDDLGDCMIYEHRPVICRLWNSTEDPKYCDSKGGHNVTRTARVVEAWAVALVLYEMDSENGIDTRGVFLHKILEI